MGLEMVVEVRAGDGLMLVPVVEWVGVESLEWRGC